MSELNPAAIAKSARMSAFPVPAGATSGIALRDWLAAAALQGVTAKGMEVQADKALTQGERDLLLAQRAYCLADAMLVARAMNNSV